VIDRTPDAQSEESGTAATLLIEPESREIRRAVGALAWCCLEELSLAARRTAEGWVAPVGVRAIGASLGVTKDTAARAVQVLVAAGLVTRRGSASCAQYALSLPTGVDIRLDNEDAGSRPANPDAIPGGRCPVLDDAARSPTATARRVSGGVTAGSRGAAECPPEPRARRKSHKGAVPQSVGQASLFDDNRDEGCEVCGQRVPEWPARWLRTDDGRIYCPDHKGDSRFRQ
jgi:hypothetical protein